MIGYIYALYDKDENDIFYIGSSLNPAMRSVYHRTHDVEYIWDEKEDDYVRCRKSDNNFNFLIIDEINFSDRNQLFSMEIYWIHQFATWGFNLRNRMFYRNRKLSN